MGTQQTRLFAADVARMAGVSEASARTYHNTAAQKRRNAERLAALEAAGAQLPAKPGPMPGPRDMPPPDGYAYPPGRRQSGEKSARPDAERRPSGAKSPYWYPETIRQWLAIRHHPGKPRKDQASPAAPGTRLGRTPRAPGRRPRRPRNSTRAA